MIEIVGFGLRFGDVTQNIFSLLIIFGFFYLVIQSLKGKTGVKVRETVSNLLKKENGK